jgi:hypothetical protein
VEDNVGIGTNNPTTDPSPANDIATGNLDVNDIFLRSTGQFVSQIVGTLVQTVYAQNGDRLLTSNTIDNHSLPSISNGLEFLRATIRPTNANNRLRIRVQAILDQSGSGRSANMVLFRGNTPISGSHLQFSESLPGYGESAFLEFETTAGTIDLVTFTVRFGPHRSPDIAAVNGRVDGSDYGRLGGIVISTIVVEELLLPN